MSKLRSFLADTRGDMLKSVALSAAVVAFASLTLTQLLDRATKDGVLPHIAIVTTPGTPLSQRMASAPRPTQITGSVAASSYDTTPIGSIGGQAQPPIVLDPCSGQRR